VFTISCIIVGQHYVIFVIGYYRIESVFLFTHAEKFKTERVH